MNAPPPSKNERDLLFVVKLASALGMGTLAGFLYSLKEVHPNLRLEFGLGAALVALATAIASWIFCGVMARADVEDSPTVARRKFFIRWLIYFGSACTLGTLFAFGYSLRNVASASRREVVEGTVLAVLVVAAGGFLIRKAFRFFEEQDKSALDERHRHDEETDE
jgi:hypothetical protein